MTDWPALLDAIDDGLTSSPPALVDFAPCDLAPLPAALASRAAQTLRQMTEVEAVFQRDQAELARELAALCAAKSSAAVNSVPPVPRFLDTKA